MSGDQRMTVAEARAAGLLPKPPVDIPVPTAAELADAQVEQSEDELQRAAVKWLKYALCDDVRFTHVPNGGKRRKIVAAKLVGLGVAKGWPDLTFAWSEPRGVAIGTSTPSSAMAEAMHLLAEAPISRSAFIELKVAGRPLTVEQRDFQRWCQQNGIPHAVARTLEEVAQAARHWGITKEGV